MKNDREKPRGCGDGSGSRKDKIDAIGLLDAGAVMCGAGITSLECLIEGLVVLKNTSLEGWFWGDGTWSEGDFNEGIKMIWVYHYKKCVDFRRIYTEGLWSACNVLLTKDLPAERGGTRGGANASPVKVKGSVVIVLKGTDQFVDERSRKTHEEFSTKLSRVRSSHSSCPQSTQQLDDDDDLIRSQCWIDVVGGKKKGRIYEAGQLAANYSAGCGGLKHQPSSSSQRPDETVHVLTQRLQTRDQEYNELRLELTSFKELVMRLLPESTMPPISHSQPTLIQPREVQPPILVQTPSPTSEPQNNEQEDNHQADHYEDY
ncbi:hypothetical protein V8G54_017181 [Vigna mungo]|uniref:Uncharacterized protein n=1 Tax=Vigna mungo TaxID=3915 RepID=A0AAQ3NPF0_VIGMU